FHRLQLMLAFKAVEGEPAVVKRLVALAEQVVVRHLDFCPATRTPRLQPFHSRGGGQDSLAGQAAIPNAVDRGEMIAVRNGALPRFREVLQLVPAVIAAVRVSQFWPV